MSLDDSVSLDKLQSYKEFFDRQVGRKYPCSNQIVVCGIVTNDRDKAIEFMKDKKAINVIKSSFQITWELENGEKWIWCNWNENQRGYRFYKVAIDRYTRSELFEFVVGHTCAMYCCSMEII